jgi:mercuric ion transport protein
MAHSENTVEETEVSIIADDPATLDESKIGVGAVALTIGGVATAFSVAACCGLPFLLATLGVGTSWLFGIAVLAVPHRSFLLVAAAVCLVGGAVLLWRQRTVAACTPGSVCNRPVVRGVTLVGLLLGFALLYLGYAYA